LAEVPTPSLPHVVIKPRTAQTIFQTMPAATSEIAA
jgi:hypothetical protein